ncbi:MAG: hypothetical protein A2X48_19185 [Lentisphaerae bacterium GWF2_49_21]|nr:MAG: hypothetical protein A2X48_19185 [Lentisphaerae bacterium GWF2_49_21]
MKKQMSMEYDSPKMKVVRGLKSLLQKKRIENGERLPTEFKIAEIYGVSRGTVRTALAELERDGFIKSVRNTCRISTFEDKIIETSFLAKTCIMLSKLSNDPAVYAESGLMWAVEAGVINACRAYGLNTMFFNEKNIKDGSYRKVFEMNPFGVLVSHSISDDANYSDGFKFAEAQGLPVVVNGGGDSLSYFDRVIADQEKGCYLLARHLADSGAKRILRLWTAPESTYWLKDRNRGFEKAIREKKLALLPPVHVKGLEDRVKGSREVFDKRTRQYAGYLAEYLTGRNRVDAIIVTADSDYYPVAAACRLFKIDPLEDVLVAGYDNFYDECEEFAWEKSVPFVTIDKRNFETGRRMFELLNSRKYRSGSGKAQLVKIEPELVKTRGCI